MTIDHSSARDQQRRPHHSDAGTDAARGECAGEPRSSTPNEGETPEAGRQGRSTKSRATGAQERCGWDTLQQ